MDTKNVIELVDELEENLEDLEESLNSVLTGSLATTSKTLPLLDRAKLNVLLVYSIESLLFSYLKLHDVQVKEHPVFKELTRVKLYFEKIKTAEAGASQPAQPSVTLNRDAAARVIKHGLAGNDKYDLERAEREAREKFLANRRLKTVEARMKEQAVQNETNGTDTNMEDVLVQAAELAAVPQDALADDASDDCSDSDEEGEIAEEQTGIALPPQSEIQPGKKRKSRAGLAQRRSKRKRETGFPNAKNDQQMAKALANQAQRKVSRKEKKKAKKTAKAAQPSS